MTDSELADLFRLFRPAFVSDLIAKGFPSSAAGSILNWFDPTKPEYLSRISSWKEFLCRGACFPMEIPPVLENIKAVARTSYGTLVISDIYLIADVHRVAMSFYKAHAPARNKTDWDSVKTRLSTPPDLGLTKSDIRQLRHALRHVDDCQIDSQAGRYGPGITAEGYSQLQRWARMGEIPDVPPSWYRVSPLDTWTPSRISRDFRCTKIAEVPKTLKSNRIVSSEPAQSMFAQLVVSDHLDGLLHRAFAGHVHLHDQALHNTLLRAEGWRSIDLSDASDYVSCSLVSQILPNLWPILAKVRSSHACFPDGDIVPLETFAPMGSGICFPILTAVNLAIGDVICRKNYSFYGDDGIVHVDDIVSVCDMQQASGLVVNVGKTCYYGLYRESCGLELLGSLDVTPNYIRDPLEESSWAKLNNLCQKWSEIGWFNSVEVVKSFVKASHVAIRVNPRYQRYEVLAPVEIQKSRPVNLDGWAGIRKWLLQRSPRSKERESLVYKRKGTLKVRRFRPLTDYPYLF
jgi:hypothetical protein